MIKRIFSAILLVATSVLLIGSFFIIGILGQYFTGQLEKELRQEAAYLALAVEAQSIPVLEKLPADAERVTLIAKDGTVLFDNKVSTDSMANHSNREEIIEAQQTGFGQARRHSETQGKSTMYYALRLSDGNILRVSSTQYSVWVLILNLIQPLAWVIIAMLILAGVFASRVAKGIVAPLNKLDLEHPERNESYDEIAPLLGKIERQQQIIRKQLSEAMHQQAEFSFITEHMSEGLLLIDAQAKLLALNDSALRLLDAHDIQVGQNVLTLNRSEQFCKIVGAALDNQHQSEVMSLDTRYCRILADPVLREKQVVGAVLLLTDVTEAVQREALRREFTANVSHELKTPLTSISGFAELMQSEMVKAEDTRRFSERIFKESQRLISLVNDIIKISQLDEGASFCEKESIELSELVLDIFDRLEAAAERRSISLRLETAEAVIIDSIRPILDEVIYNLCDNAIKYNRPSGTVTVSLAVCDDMTTLSVADTGIGIAKADCPRVFERFYRVDKSHSKEIGGTGLGLAIVKHGAAYLGAELQLESTLEVGSTFTLIWRNTER